MILVCAECGEQVEGELYWTHFRQGKGAWRRLPVPCGTLYPLGEQQRTRLPRRRMKHRTMTAAEVERLYGQWRKQ